MKILLVEDSPDDALLLRRHLSREGITADVWRVESEADMRLALATEVFDIVITDYVLPDFSALGAIALAAGADADLPVIVMSGTVGEESAAEVMRAGAHDFLLKASLGRLAMATRREVDAATLRRRRRRESTLMLETQVVVRVGAWEWNEAKRALYWTAGVDRLLGIEPGTPASLDLARRFLASDDLGRLQGLLRGERREVDLDVRVRTVAGRDLVLQVTGRVVLDAHGAPIRAIGTVLDVTERRQLESSFRLQERLVAMGTIAAGVAHEINNPLTHLVAALPLVVEHHRRVGGDEAGLGMLKDCIDGAERIASIVRDLKVFTRADESNGFCEVDTVLTSVLSLLNLNYRHAAVIESVVPAQLAVAVPAPRLAQVLTNLIINAVQSMPARNAALNRVHVGAEIDGGIVVLTVRDNGSGIHPDVLPRVFSPFFTTKPVDEGTGLGLAVCREIVDGLGGAIEISETGARGTTFVITLPAATMATPSLPLAVGSGLGARRLRVLIVDDEPRLRSLTARLLRSHEVVVTGSVDEALTVLAANVTFDVVLCDLMMPGRPGMELYVEVERSDPALATRFVFASGGAVTAASQAFLQALPPDRILMKPFSREQLFDIVERVGGSS